MKPNKAMILTFAEKCKNVLSSNWQGQLNTIKADAKGSKEDIYTSKVKYLYKRGRPYIWIPEKELHHVNTVIDERGSFAVTSPFPGPLANILRSIKKLPARVALTGDVVRLKDEKSQLAEDSLRATILAEKQAISESSYAVTGILSSSDLIGASRSENLQDLLDASQKYLVYKFNPRSCMFIDCTGGIHEVELEDVDASRPDLLSPFAAKLIDGINQSDARRRALILFCHTYMNANAKDAYVLSIDRKGFDVLGKVPGPMSKDGSREYRWKEFRFTFKEEARSIETFCSQLVQMEEEVLNKIKSSSGLL